MQINLMIFTWIAFLCDLRAFDAAPSMARTPWAR